MKLTLGAEPNKVKWLGGLLAVLIGFWLYNPGGDTPTGSSTPATGPKTVGSSPAAPPPIARPGNSARGPVRAGSRQQLRSTVQDFKPKLFDKDNPVDPTKVDPTLAQQTITRLQSVTLSGGGRSLFDFGASSTPAPKIEGPIIKPVQRPKRDHPIYGPERPVDPPKIVAEVKPVVPPTPIPLKFYGFVFSQRQGAKRAFFMEGEDIYIAGEGETMKGGKYRLVKIGVNSATVEDVPNKNQQALPLVEEQQGG